MPCTLTIQLNEANKGAEGWKDALKACATEFHTVINPALVSMGRKAIKVNPDAVNVEDFLGDVNTPPTESDDWELAGHVRVIVGEYDWINSRFFAMLPTAPTTFWLVGGAPPAGVFA